MKKEMNGGPQPLERPKVTSLSIVVVSDLGPPSTCVTTATIETDGLTDPAGVVLMLFVDLSLPHDASAGFEYESYLFLGQGGLMPVPGSPDTYTAVIETSVPYPASGNYVTALAPLFTVPIPPAKYANSCPNAQGKFRK